MSTENRKPAGDEPADHPAEEPAKAPPGDTAPASDAETAGPENGIPEAESMAETASGWSARAGEAAQAAASQAPPESEADPIARLEAEKSDLTDRLLRVVADMDNLRKRTERELTDARKFSLAGFAGDMLSVSDNLKRALDAVPQQARDSGDEALDGLLAGVEMTGREMDRMLEKNGVTRIDALGERFDPHCHQAMFEVPDESVPNRTVVEVVQDGYRIGERILRAAMVGVTKGGPKAAKPEPVSEPANDDPETDLPEPPEAA